MTDRIDRERFVSAIEAGLNSGCWFGAGAAFPQYTFEGNTRPGSKPNVTFYLLRPTVAEAPAAEIYVGLLGGNRLLAQIQSSDHSSTVPGIDPMTKRIQSDIQGYFDGVQISCDKADQG